MEAKELIEKVATDLKIHNERLKNIQTNMQKLSQCVLGNGNPKGSLTDRISVVETYIKILSFGVTAVATALIGWIIKTVLSG